MQTPITGRPAILDVLLETTIPVFLNLPPSRDNLRAWFNQARIPRSKPTRSPAAVAVTYTTENFARRLENALRHFGGGAMPHEKMSGHIGHSTPQLAA